MKYEYPLTILTPTYNRKNTITKLYDSLKKQTIKNFQWLVIDDGSVDDTRNYFETLKKDEKFTIEYYYKNNAGKHTALNYAHPYIKGELVCIVDSDDWLLPTAVETILKYWGTYSNNSNICGLTFLKGYDENKSVANFNNISKEPVISNHIDYRVNAGRKGDCCEIIRSKIFQEFKFPEFENEKFLGESYLWNSIGFNYDTVYINEILYICEYLEGGLTKSGRKLRISCPYGGMANSKTYFIRKNNRKVKLKILIKEAWLFICYGKFAKLSRTEIINKSETKYLIRLNWLFGGLLHCYWKKKFK